MSFKRIQTTLTFADLEKAIQNKNNRALATMKENHSRHFYIFLSTMFLPTIQPFQGLEKGLARIHSMQLLLIS